jgi:MFS family permease
MVFGLAAAFFADYWKGQGSAGSESMGYTIPLIFGALTLGLASPLFMSLMPEPLMQPTPGPQPSLLSSIATPFRDKNYRYLLRFLFLWGLAINLATPFFAVYMLQRLGLPLSAVIGFSVLSQATNIMFLRIWGNLADRVGIKAVLSVCVSLYLLVVLGWVFTTMPERYFLSIPLLIILHILAGIAVAGVSLTTGTIGLKLAPQGQATYYLSGAAIALNLGAGLGPLLGGLFADFFTVREFSVNFTWIDPSRAIELPALSLTGFDFLFGITFMLGLLTLPLLSALREEGEGSKELVLESLYAPMRDLSRPMSSIPALSFIGQFPFSYLRRVPVPGLDAAMGVTAYQVAAMTKGATISVAKGKKATGRIIKPLEESLAEIWKFPKEMGQHGAGVAREAARGAMHAVDEVTFNMEHLSHDVVLAITRATRHSQIKPQDVLREASYGVVRGAGETSADVGEAALQAVEAAKEVADQSGLSQELATCQAAQGAIEAAVTLGPEAEKRVREALPAELLDLTCTGPAYEDDTE